MTYIKYSHDLLAVGDETIPRNMAYSTITMASGWLRLAYFTARSSYTATQVRLWSASTAAAATPDLVRAGVYSVAANGDLTRIAAIVSDTSIFATANTSYTRSFNSPSSVAIVRGTRYALGVIVVSGVATPTMPGAALGITTTEYSVAPRLQAVLTGQTDLPASATAASLLTNASNPYGVILP